MADRVVEVVVAMGRHDVLAGRMHSHRVGGKESASFSYDPSYMARPGAYALDPALPLYEGAQQTPIGIPMFRAFADTAPDRWGRAVIRRAEAQGAKARGGTPNSFGDVDYLLGVGDDLRQGALRFRDPATNEFLASAETGVPPVTGLARLLHAADNLEADHETEEDLRLLLRGGSSLGGARPKAHVLDAEGRVSIAKFPRSEYDEWDVEAWEGVALTLAARAGINVPDAKVIHVTERSVLVVSRFDRDGERRIGYMSAMTMLEGVDGDTGSYLDIASAIEEHSLAPTDDLRELWRRIAFNILISNTDDHMRNHGFLHAGGEAWNLSPAFDLNPVPDPGVRHLRTAVDEADTTASVETLMSVAPYFRLDERESAEVLKEALEATREWKDVADRNDIPKAQIDLMTPAFEHPESEFAEDFVGTVATT